jgi:gluconokinase
MTKKSKNIYVVMGVSGSGKSTIGKLLAQKFKIPFLDGDDYHPPSNIKKMATGIPLDDEDRQGWLERLNLLGKENLASGAVIACSALKESYRDILEKDLETSLIWIYLKGSFEEISDRLKKRKGHFMPSALLKSQFDVLEPPTKAITIDIVQDPEQMVSQICEQIII